MRISDWSSDVCSSDLHSPSPRTGSGVQREPRRCRSSKKRFARYRLGCRNKSGMTNRAMPPFELPPQSSTPASVTPVLNIAASILRQPWHWRSLAASARDTGQAPQDLVTTLLLERGCYRGPNEAHKAPRIRGLLTDPSVLSD